MTKRVVSLVLSLLVALLFAGCGSVIPPSEGAQGPSSSGVGSVYDERSFVVFLVCDGKPYAPEIEMAAQWSGAEGIYSATFDQNGVAVMEGLDGEYHVTLSAVPEGYTYDRNGYVANIHRKHIEVELLRIIPTKGTGAGLYQNTGCIRLTQLGTYRATLNSASQVVYYEYKPTSQGKYSVTSWVDTTENQLNPIMDYHRGTVGFKAVTPTEVYNDGGASSTYTKNFRFIIEAAADMVSGGTQGGVWTFGVHADVVRGKEYPVTVDFTIKFEGDYNRDQENYTPVYATGNLQNIKPAGTFRYNYADNARLLDGTRFVLDPSDGYYHLVSNPDKILFAMLNKDCEVFAPTESGMGFMDVLIYGRLYFYGKNYLPFMDAYAAHCNSDGAHPVTQELKEFLQAYATSPTALLFMDGNGIAETKTKLKSAEDDQWLFACGYYV